MPRATLDSSQQKKEESQIIGNTAYVIDEAIRSLREISNNLSPQILNDFGLARGVNNFINKSLAINKIKINFTTNLKGERFNTDVEVILYRVICELINNSIKHSDGTEINLTLLYNDQTLSLAYSDNGRGFDLPAVLDVGMGLSNITSRIQSLKGECDIRSEKGEGMYASIRINLSKGQSWR